MNPIFQSLCRYLLGVCVAVGTAVEAQARGRSGYGGHSQGGSTGYVKAYTRSNGTYVQPHYRSGPDGDFYNNWTTVGNTNPYTGECGTKTCPNNVSAAHNVTTTSVANVIAGPRTRADSWHRSPTDVQAPSPSPQSLNRSHAIIPNSTTGNFQSQRPANNPGLGRESERVLLLAPTVALCLFGVLGLSKSILTKER
jgi:hypothetical protein